ncbi:MAG: aminopeptidase [Methanomassiliicoccales archaeon]|nr:aminopeptidase [Methanomassiliicoccales archaeon]
MAVTEKTQKACAKSMVETCNPKKGDGVVVRGGAHNQILLEEIALECWRHGATPTIVTSSDRYARAVYREMSAKVLETVPRQYVGMVKASDLIISVEEFDDPRIAEDFPSDKIAARQKANLPLNDIIFHSKNGKKWLYAGWPTEKAAAAFGIPYGELFDIVIGGISVRPADLMKTGRRIHGLFDNASWVHVWDDNGTDFRVKVTGRRLNIDDGFISDEDYGMGDRGANLPAGEVFYAPHETAGEGSLYCPITRDRMTDRLVKEVHIEFKNGKILLDKTTASKNGDAMLTSFARCEKIDKKKYKPVRTRNVAELGIGFNPKIKKAIGYILTDEKVNGTVHLAFGANNTYGGKSESTMHWDFVSAPGVNIEVDRTDGKSVLVMEKGKFV